MILPPKTAVTDIVSHSYRLGQQILAARATQRRKQHGQFLTPPPVARYMAQNLAALPENGRILDPGIGSSVLACACIEQAVQIGYPTKFTVEGYELDAELLAVAQESLDIAAAHAAEHGLDVQIRLHQADFILAHTATWQPTLFPYGDNFPSIPQTYNAIIANPPYFKLPSHDPRAQAATGKLAGHTNIYTLFMALAANLLTETGQACFIVPRSFCSGAYFARFRQAFIAQVIPTHVHLLTSRKDTFKTDDVLQENIILTFRPRLSTDATPQTIHISATQNGEMLSGHVLSRPVPFARFLGRWQGRIYFRLPVSELDEQIIATIESWTGSLAAYGTAVSTGPVVAFRAQPWLTEAASVPRGEGVPLFWMQNVATQSITWPVQHKQKPQAILIRDESQSLLVSTANFVLIRRFSAKEERRRLTAAPFLQSNYPYDQIGIENHLNYIYRQSGEMTETETVGLSALLNSALIDRYFRISSGNTQVNALID